MSIDMNVVINQMIMFFLMMSLGYLLYKKDIFDNHFLKKATSFMLYVTMPAMMLASALDEEVEQNLHNFFLVFAIAAVMFFLLPFVGMLVAKIIGAKMENKGLYVFMIIFSNIGFMGFPIMDAMLGAEAVFYTAIFNMLFNILVFTLGVKVINYPEKSEKKSLKQIILHPGVIGATLAIVIYILDLRIPKPIAGTINLIGGITSPMAMLLVGAALAKLPIKNIFNEKRVYLFTFIKQFIIPVISWLIIKTFIDSEELRVITLVMMCMPVANTAVMFATEYEKNEELAAKSVFITTIVSLFSFPLTLWISNYL